jgi:flagellar biosynthesis anti-sigma factor FlgM
MASEIKGLDSIIRPNGLHGTSTSTGAVNPPGRGPLGAMGTDRVSITDAATSLRTTEKTVRQLPVVDAVRVGNIREEIAGGTYHLAPRRIAKKLMQFELLYLGAGSRVGLYASA